MNSKIKHTRWFCYDHTPTTSSLKLWKATTIPLLRNGTKSIGYLLPLERETRFELATLTLARLCSTYWATLALHKIDSGPTSRSKHGRALFKVYFERVVGLEPTLFHIGSVVPYLLGDTRNCVLSWIWTMDHLINSQGLYRWAKKTLCREDRIWTCDLLVPNQARYRATLLPYFISYMSKNTTNIRNKSHKNKKPRTLMFRVSKFWLFIIPLF